jgi:hypothetical protein
LNKPPKWLLDQSAKEDMNPEFKLRTDWYRDGIRGYFGAKLSLS